MIQLLLQGALNSNADTLHIAARRSTASRLEQLLLELDGADVDMKDSKGLTPLHHAAMFRNTEAVRVLIHSGAALNTMVPKTLHPRLTTLAYVLRRTPYAKDAILERLDDSITLAPNGTSLVFDFTRWNMEHEKNCLMHVFAEEERKLKGQRDSDLIEHPLVQQMLEQSWNWKAHAVYFALLIFKLFYLLAMGFVIMAFNGLAMSNSAERLAVLFTLVTLAMLILYLLVHLIGMVRQISIYVSAGATYCRENFAGMLLGILSFQNICNLLCVPGSLLLAALLVYYNNAIEEHSTHFDGTEIAIALFLAGWFDLLIHISDSRCVRNNFGMYYQMFYIVVVRFVNVLFAFFIFLAGFGICFWMYSKDTQQSHSENDDKSGNLIGFEELHLVIAKIFVMLVGEIEYDGMYKFFQDKAKKSKRKYFAEIPIACIVVFVMAVPIVLQNLLVALVIADIAEINNQALGLKLKSEARQLKYLQKFWDTFCCSRCCTHEAATPTDQISVPFSMDNDSHPDHLYRAYEIAKSKQNEI